MTEPAIPQTLLNNMFSRDQLLAAVGHDRPLYHLIEHLAFESVYSLHDDFDKGIDPARWVSSGFTWQEGDFFGSIANLDNSEDESEDAEPSPSAAYIFSKVKGWQTRRRCTATVRFTLSSASHGKIEFGFASDPADEVFGIIDSTARPTHGKITDYGMLLWNPNDSTTQPYAIARAYPTAGVATALVAGVPIRTAPGNLASWSSPKERVNTLLVALNERNEVKCYVNGQFINTAVSGGPGAAADLGIWFHVGPNRATSAPLVNLDYVHAWQERIPL